MNDSKDNSEFLWVDFDEVRAAHSLRGFCASRSIELKESYSGRLVACCPLHNEKSPSFTVYPDGHFYCFGCGAHGDVIDLCAQLDGIDLCQAAQKLSGTSMESSSQARLPNIKPSPLTVSDIPYQLSATDIDRMAGSARRLACSKDLILEMVAERAEWDPEMIRDIALEGDLGSENNKIFFGYRHGIKARWDRDGKRVIRWACGTPAGECWRQSLLLASHEFVHITEGETDAITLLSQGIEEPGLSLVVALAGALIMPRPEPFTGRHIVIVPDPDAAGTESEKKLRAVLQPVARSITTVQLAELV
jgi:CHC2 zinc finger